MTQWRSLSDGRLGLEFSPRGWAMVEFCALLAEYHTPRDLLQDMVCHIVDSIAETPSKQVLNLQWQTPSGHSTAVLVLSPNALDAISQECEMAVSELQVVIQSSIEMSLAQIYKEHGRKHRLH